MKQLLMAFLALLLSVHCAGAGTGDPAVGALIDKLVEKGVINKEEALELERGLKKPADQGEEAKQPVPEKAKLKLPFEIKIRAQTRLDVGDLLVDRNGKYETESDLYLRRVRLEIDKEFKNPPIGKELDLDLTLEADRFEQNFRNGRRVNPSDDVGLQYLYADWIFFDEFAVEIGKHKQPYLRVELTSSARQLLIDRPATTSGLNASFGDYHETQIMAHGDVAGGALRYYLSYSDGSASLDALQDLDSAAVSVQRRGWGKAVIGRMEIAPLGFPNGAKFTERKKDDTGIGAESHLTLGIDGGFQQEITYATATVADARLNSSLISVDLAGRYVFPAGGALTGQSEYVFATRDFNYRADQKPQGGYVQAGYLLPWTVLHGKVEPALRYEIYDEDAVRNAGASGSRQKLYTIGFNHYLQAHSVKWAYNFVHTRFSPGVAEAPAARNKDVHEVQLQLYF